MRSSHIKRHMTVCTKNGGDLGAGKVQIQFEPDEQSTSSAERAPGKQIRLLTREKLLSVKNDKLRRQFAPIRNWSSLEIGKPYLFRRVVPIEVKRKRNGDSTNNWSLSHYAELVCAEEPLINVWLTPAMAKESENYYLETEDFYIVPLGKRVSQKNRREYHIFIIVPGNELVF